MTVPPGHCYPGSFILLKAWSPRLGDRLRLCHGVARERGVGASIGHAWLEVDGVACVDYREPGRLIPLEVYYAAGEVREAQRYTLAEAMALRSEECPYGPWQARQ